MPAHRPAGSRRSEGPYNDFYAQALAKTERNHRKDREDVAAMIAAGLVQPRRLLDFFEAIEPQLYRYPAIDPKSFRTAVEAVARG